MSAVPLKPAIERIAAAHQAARSRLRGGPRWAARRDAALARLQTRGLPNRRDENWKYLDWPELESRSFEVPGEISLSATQLAGTLLKLDHALRIVLVNGRFVPALSEGAIPEGLALTGLADAAERDPALLDNALRVPDEAADDRFALLAEAFADDGVVIRVQPGAQIAETLYLVHVTSAAVPSASHSRVVIEAGRGSRLRVVEHFVSLDTQPSLSNLAGDIRIGEAAALEHIRLHEQAATAAHIETLQATQGRDSHYLHQCFSLGGRLVRTNLRVRLEGPGASNDVQGLFMVDGQRQADVYTLMEHVAPHTRTDEMYRGVASDRGRGAFNGKIVVHEGAVKADSRQSSRNLILSPLAEINARPQLEILTDDVKCSHGATTGSLDADQLFYLLSRGIDPPTARGLLTFAFCEDVVSRVSIEAIRRHVEQQVLGRLPDRDIIKEFV